MNNFKKDVSKLHSLETRFSKKTIACAITLSLGISAIPLSSFAATISGIKFVDDNRTGVRESSEPVYTGGGDIYLKLVTAPATQRPISTWVSSNTGTYSLNIPSTGAYKIWQYVNPTSPLYSIMSSSEYFASETTARIINISSLADTLYLDFPVPNLSPDSTAYINGAETLANTICSNTIGAHIISASSSGTTFFPSNLNVNTTVIIPPNVTVTIPDSAPPIHIKAICNYGTLKDNDLDGLTLHYDSLFANFETGKIEGNNGSSSEINGSSITLEAHFDTNLGGYRQCDFGNTYGDANCQYYGLFYNEGLIQAGNGLNRNYPTTVGVSYTPNMVGGAGGSISIIGNKSVVQNGKVFGGSGGNVNFDSAGTSANSSGLYEKTLGGNGGAIAIIAGTTVTGNNHLSETKAGEGGDVTATNICSGCTAHGIFGGSGGELTIDSGGFVTLVGNYRGHSIWVDPTVSFIGSDTTLIADQDITIHGGDNWLLELRNLRPESIMAGRKIILATGAGGTIDLRGNNAKIFKAGDRVEIYTDNLLLDAGVTLESLVDAPNGVIRSGAKIIYHATITGSSQLNAKAGETINAQLDLRNASPKQDSYVLKAVTNDGVVLNGLPTNLTIDGLKSAPLNLSIAVPANLSTESTSITITATSQTDPTVIATFELRLSVPQTNCAEPATYDTSTRIVNLPKIDIPLLSPIDGKPTGEIAIFSGQLEQMSGVEDFKIRPDSLKFLSFSKAYDPSHARYSFNTGLFSNGGLLKTCVAVPQIIVIPPNIPIYTDPKHYLVTLRQLAVSPDTFHVESVDAANP